MGVKGERPQESYERLLAATKPNKRLSDNEQYHDLMTQDFEDVYKESPKSNYREEWHFYLKFNNDYLSASVRTDGPYIILYSATKEEETESPEYRSYIEATKGEQAGPPESMSYVEAAGPQEDHSHEYVFQKTGPTWKILYEGQELNGLKGDGFKYIQYLIKHPHKKFHPNELDCGINGHSVQSVENGHFDENWDQLQSLDNHEASNKDEIGDEEARKQLKQKLESLDFEIEEAKRNQDLQKAEALKEQRENHVEHCKGYFGFGGKRREFVDPETRLKNRIAKSIERAVGKIEKYDKVAGKHFRDSLKPINSFEMVYRPDRKIEWRVE